MKRPAIITILCYCHFVMFIFGVPLLLVPRVASILDESVGTGYTAFLIWNAPFILGAILGYWENKRWGVFLYIFLYLVFRLGEVLLFKRPTGHLGDVLGLLTIVLGYHFLIRENPERIAKGPHLQMIIGVGVSLILVYSVGIYFIHIHYTTSQRLKKLLFQQRMRRILNLPRQIIQKPKPARPQSTGGCNIQGIVSSAEGMTVMINNHLYTVNDSACGGKITNISPDAVMIQFADRAKLYRLKEDNP